MTEYFPTVLRSFELRDEILGIHRQEISALTAGAMMNKIDSARFARLDGRPDGEDNRG
jgi:hypothetical protein